MNTPDTERPSVINENRFRERTRSNQPLDDGLGQEAAPEMPKNGFPGDPFRTVPETEVPDLDLVRPMEGPADGGEDVLGGFDDDADGLFDFGPADPPADEPGLPGLDDPPGELEPPPFGSNRRRSPKRLALKLTRGHQQNDQVGLAIVPPANASSMTPIDRPRILPESRLDRSVGRSLSNANDEVFAPEAESKQNQIDQISFETEIDRLPSAPASTVQNPLRSPRRLHNDRGNEQQNHFTLQYRGIATTTSPAIWAINAEQTDTVARQTRSSTPLPRSRSTWVHKNPYR